ncbi:hypothetical protein IA01_11495 [Flavobacterium psychrophilum]|uniref:Hypothetical transmembrane protein n=1 Tax=Flavobacterium psychrophilum (strain ATCC 49511 / DSM 21280 / CIP 103535 / JIP02/86) TaxID=402612 RepID=A6H1Z6_FLAPJ|nr:hypothetical protein [Flavobacterium psychrophilum]AIG31041.1 hypothetical protein IA03_11465 [Flavobacterium psychrophilum]AIG33318.1 hypothetical protein IA01_11495 [Flavobacterium psychrophilum]AIG35467.1 hypothetical protein IA02_10860 [Flavobacterium psychrophilum]AIG37828.1 hypothetical protein IA04_11340 [Flavobacterium psychrophilum]AIG40099.1 hypothetical protein IA05_11460 [Flavobacterium psychrophilum]
MVVLKKIKSATLVEALVATILIVIIFVIASLVLNNLVLNTLSKNTHQIEYRLNELEYDLQNQAIKIPYEEEYEDWEIIIQKEKIQSNGWLNIVASNKKTNKEVIRKRIHE